MKNGPYEFMFAPESFPGKKYRDKYCYVHTFILWSHTGKIPSKDESIHHINGNKMDNRIENLQLKKIVDHVSEHSHKKGRTMGVFKCPTCGKIFRERTWSSKKNPNRLRFCSRHCIGKFNFYKKNKEQKQKAFYKNLIKVYKQS